MADEKRLYVFYGRILPERAHVYFNLKQKKAEIAGVNVEFDVFCFGSQFNGTLKFDKDVTQLEVQTIVQALMRSFLDRLCFENICAYNKHGEGLRLRHHGHDPARKLGLVQRALWLEERPHLEDYLVRLVILGREVHEGARVLNSRFEVRRPLAARLRIDEIVHCDGPWGFEKRLYFTEEGFCEAIERIGTSPPRLEEARENAALLRHRGHPLTADRGEAADRVPERDQPARKAAELVESAQHAASHPEPRDVADALRAADRIVDRRQAERLGERHEPIDVAGRRFAVVYAKRDAPSSPLDGQEDPEAAAARRRRRVHHAEPIRRSVLGLLEDRRRIGLIDADLDRRRLRRAGRFEEAKRWRRSPRGVDDQIRRESSPHSAHVLEAHPRNRAIVRRGGQLRH